MMKFLGGFLGVLTALVILTHEISPHLRGESTLIWTGSKSDGFTSLEIIQPNQSANFAWGQTGPTGPTGPTGSTGPAGSVGTYNGHTIFGGSAPTVTECGQNATLETGSNDNAGGILVSATPTVKPVTVCTITFAVAFTHAPAMAFTTSKNQVLVSPLTITTTAVRFRLSADMTGGVITYSAF